MMARLMIIGAALALAGCATQAPKPQMVDVPVAVGCLGDVPARPVSRYGAGDWPGDKAAAQAALTDASAWEQYAIGLEGAWLVVAPARAIMYDSAQIVIPPSRADLKV